MPALDEIADTVDDLEAELDADVVDGLTVSRILSRLGTQTRAVASRAGAPARLPRLATVLDEASTRLRQASKGS